MAALCLGLGLPNPGHLRIAFVNLEITAHKSNLDHLWSHLQLSFFKLLIKWKLKSFDQYTIKTVAKTKMLNHFRGGLYIG